MYKMLRLSILGMAAAVMFAASPVRADSVLYNASGFIQGQQSFTQSFDITSPGVVTISLSNIPWLDTIAGLSSFLSTSSGVVTGSLMGPGTESFDVQPGMLYAHWFGDANGSYGVGVYGIEVQFQALTSPGGTPVPLPTSSILLLCGLGLLWAWQRRPESPATASGPLPQT